MTWWGEGLNGHEIIYEVNLVEEKTYISGTPAPDGFFFYAISDVLFCQGFLNDQQWSGQAVVIWVADE
jgi:hypothetical protein